MIGVFHMQTQLFDRTNIDCLDWPETEDGSYAKRLLPLFIKNGTDAYIDNIHADTYALKIDNLVLPIIVTDHRLTNSWVCSTYTQYIAYGQEFTTLINNKCLATTVKTMLNAFGRGATFCNLNAAVYVNNWLFAVDLLPAGFADKHIHVIKKFLIDRFPDHAIVFRSINPLLHPKLMPSFSKSGFKTIASRYIHITDTANESIFNTRIVKSDLKLFKEAPYQILDGNQLSKENLDKLLDLYHSLYIKQHSTKNPQINKEYFDNLFRQELLKFKIVKQGENIQGVAGYIERNGVFLCPFFGYDKTDPNHNIIYRLLSTALILEAKKKGLVFHQSAGASFYKSIRRSKGCFEYNAVYIDHLPFKQRLGWNTLKMFINTIAPPFMKKY